MRFFFFLDWSMSLDLFTHDHGKFWVVEFTLDRLWAMEFTKVCGTVRLWTLKSQDFRWLHFFAPRITRWSVPQSHSQKMDHVKQYTGTSLTKNTTTNSGVGTWIKNTVWNFSRITSSTTSSSLYLFNYTSLLLWTRDHPLHHFYSLCTIIKKLKLKLCLVKSRIGVSIYQRRRKN